MRIGTGAYEGHFRSTREALDAVRVAFDFLDALPPRFEVDHLWVYVDEDEK